MYKTNDNKIQSYFTNRKVIILSAIFCCFLWGSAFPAVKNGYILFNIPQNDIPSKMLFAGYRFFLAGVIVLIVAKCFGRRLLELNKNNIGQILLLGVTQTSLQYIFFYIGLAYTTGVKGAIISSTSTFFSIIIAHFLYKNDRLSKIKVLGCLLGFIGVIIINIDTSLLEFKFSLKGEGFVLISAFAASVASIYGKRITQVLDSMVVTGYQLAIGGGVLMLIGGLNHGTVLEFNIKSTFLLLYLAILSSIAFLLWTILLKYNKVGEITIFSFFIPVFGAILSAFFLNENILKLKNIFALIFVSLGVWMINAKQGEKSLD